MYLAKLIVQAYHHNFKHPIGCNLAKNRVQRDGYFILGLDKFFRTVKNECTICKYRENQPLEPQMAASRNTDLRNHYMRSQNRTRLCWTIFYKTRSSQTTPKVVHSGFHLSTNKSRTSGGNS